MGQYFRRVSTRVKEDDCLRLLVNAWQKRFGALPKEGAVRLMASQWGFETSYGKTGACYNFGNQRPRSKASDDYTHISGDEIINGKRVAFSDDTPSDLARFRAFPTPQAGADACVEHIARLSEVMRVLNGSCAPEDFVAALKHHKYFTASLELYTKRYLGVYKFIKDTRVPSPGTVEGYPTLNEEREAMIWDEIARGNSPSFVELFAPVVLTNGKGRRATFQVSVDCFAIGTEADWLRVPLSGYYAQKVADHFGCLLPTNKIVFETYKQAEKRLVAHMLEC